MLKCPLVPKVLGRQTPTFKRHCRACLEAQGMKAPQGFGHCWRRVGRWEPKALISDPITPCPRCHCWCSPTLFNGNTIILEGFFRSFFFLVHQDTTWNRDDLGCELSVGCLSVTRDVLCLSHCQLWWFICAVSQRFSPKQETLFWCWQIWWATVISW